MSSGVIIFLEISLVLGLCLVFGVRELRNLRRYDRERAERNKAEADGAGSSIKSVRRGILNGSSTCTQRRREAVEVDALVHAPRVIAGTPTPSMRAAVEGRVLQRAQDARRRAPPRRACRAQTRQPVRGSGCTGAASIMAIEPSRR